jgi:RNA polymerase sigma factor (TIGR02999 family)
MPIVAKAEAMTEPTGLPLVDGAVTSDPSGGSKLLPLVYDELRRLAAQRLASERAGHTLQATALVHEAYLRLVGGQPSQRWDGRGHFFAAAAEAMRRILIDSARRRRRPKHGGDRQRVDLDDAANLSPPPGEDLLALDEALTRLAAEAPVKAELVKLRFFAGMTIPDAAHVLGISEATAQRYWTFARVWLYSELDHSEATEDPSSDNPRPT